MWLLRTAMKSRLAVIAFFFLISATADAQRLVNRATAGKASNLPSADKLFTPARISEDTIYLLDQAHTVKHMDANPDGSHWYVVDLFANWQTITIDGHRLGRQFHEIPSN